MLTDDLLELQQLDTSADQLTYRRAHLDERVTADAATAAVRDAERRRHAGSTRIDELEVAIGDLEVEGQQLTKQRTRLEAQLKTVIAPREAEALMHELDAIARHRDELDDRELAHLEEQSELATTIASLDDDLPALRVTADEARAVLAAVESDIDAQLAALTTARLAVAAGIDAVHVERYDRLRTRYGGVAVARLDGMRCTGCHLDLSRGELDQVRAVGPGEFADCPQCGRLLVP